MKLKQQNQVMCRLFVVVLVFTIFLVQPMGAQTVLVTPDPQQKLEGDLQYVEAETYQLKLVPVSAMESSLTTVSSLTVGANWAVQATEKICLAGFASIEESLQPKITLEWSKVSGGWLPLWRIHLCIDGQKPNELATLTPSKGSTYQALLSYDADSGAISWWVFDTTQESLVTSGGRGNIPNQGELSSAVAGVLQERRGGTTGVYVEGIQVYRKYIPVGSQTQLLSVKDNLAPKFKFERTEEAITRLLVPGATAPGEYSLRFVNRSTGEVHEIGPFAAAGEQRDIPLSLMKIPPGEITLEMLYIDDGHVWLTRRFDLTIGRLTVAYDRIAFERDARRIQSAAHIQADYDTAGLGVEIMANLSRQIWDEEEKRYYSQEYPPVQCFAGLLSIGQEPTTVPLSLVVPQAEKKGLWQVEFTAVSVPVLDTDNRRASHLFTDFLPSMKASEVYPFSIVVLPDTQYYTQDHPYIFTRQTEWLAANAQDQNIRLMLHVGDIVNNGTHTQWERADRILSVLDGIVPYVLAVGNHDLVPRTGSVQNRTSTLFNNYFPVSRYQDLPYFGGVFQEGRHENSYYTFQLGGERILVLSLEFGPRDGVLAWANQIVEAYDDHQVIIITHTYTSTSGKRITPSTTSASPQAYPISQDPNETVNDGEQMWEKLVRKHQNIRLVLSGHTSISTMRSEVAIGDHGNFVYEILADYQGEPKGGEGWLVLMEFLDERFIEVRAYSPYYGEYETKKSVQGFTNHFMIDRQEGVIRQLAVITE
ncbi:MAG: metallophosphoesterase [Limnochordia bacterium]|nr:metallophosphoesterase [Limnochordia bacterium]